MTNADVIRSMNDEELADFLARIQDRDIETARTFCFLCKECGSCDGCMKWWLGIDCNNHPQGLKYWEAQCFNGKPEDKAAETKTCLNCKRLGESDDILF